MSTPKELAELAVQLSKQMFQFAQALEQMSGLTSELKPTESSVKSEKNILQKNPTIPQVTTSVSRPYKATYNDDPAMPGYDPSPPFPVEAVPPRHQGIKPGQLVIAKDSIFVCRACNKPVVIANRDIYNSDGPDGLSVTALDIMDARYKWPDTVTVEMRGGVCVACPVCNKMSLWLVGSPKPMDNVGSIERTGTL